MRNFFVYILLAGFLFILAHCKKDAEFEPVKQYLFDGLPYYLTDTLFVEEFDSMEMLGHPYYIRFDSKGYAWILDVFGLLYRYDRVEEELIWWNSEELLGPDVPGNVRPFFIDSKDRIWVPQYGTLYLLEGNSSKKMTFGYDQDAAFNVCEDSNGLIHFLGLDSRKAYVCDGESVSQVDPVFVDGDYKLYGMVNDHLGNIWYNVDLTPSIPEDQGMYIVKYSSEDDFVLIPELQNNSIGELTVSSNFVVDSKNNIYIDIPSGLWSINNENEWQLIVGRTEMISSIYIFIDHEDQVWANLSRGETYANFLGVVKDGSWSVVTKQMSTIRDRNSVVDISFPDENTVWVSTSNMVYEFKK